MNYAYLTSPVGRLLITATDTAITGLYLENGRYAPPVGSEWIENIEAVPIAEACRQLDEYFAGTRTTFDLPLAPQGTEFQRRVWDELTRIPHGVTISYGELASRLGNAKASRAVGLANGRNPISVVVPCHRVVGANGHLTGYSGGLSVKQALLALEQRGIFTHSVE